MLMNRTLNALLIFSLAVGLAAQANAQLVTYKFTGTKISGAAGFGTTIAGTVTLDLGAAPHTFVDTTPYHGSGQYALWLNGGFSINGMTDTGFAAGTSFGGTTHFYNYDLPTYSRSQTMMYNSSVDGTRERGIYIFSVSLLVGDGLANVPNPWDPRADQYHEVFVFDYDHATGISETGVFKLDTFTLKPPTIIINGRDTGIDDFVYGVKLVSEHLDVCAADAKNHGNYVSCVAKLTNDLKKAGLLTAEQKSLIMSYAAQSDIGK